ncbi:hypothetical protein [Polyangium fumosum]|uniref:Secreted protein n=1 Tax=Polyangium fumosum TaxID=889272 RepID=A0A4U1JDP2_9BACT|nr:hypothetical protein [Polyangium fumosum]TKD08950.1 hypothetical protein E8A74_14295 [Polyangium fumosum]
MIHHRALSLAAALFVMPFAAGCVAEEEEVGDEVVEVEGPGLSEEWYNSVPYLSCAHQNGFGMVCNYSGGGNSAYWQYDYLNTAWLDGPMPMLPSANTVNWGNCHDPGSAPASFVIHVEAWNQSFGNYATLYMPCL